MAALNLQSGSTNGQVINSKSHLTEIVWSNFLERGEEGYSPVGQTSNGGDQLIQDKIIEDIIKGFTSKKDIVGKSLNSLTWNITIDKVIEIIQDKTKLINEKKKWVKDWKETFQKNPTKDLSSIVTDYISKKLGSLGDKPGNGSWMDMANSAPDYKEFFTNIAKNEISTFFDDLDKQTPNIIKASTFQTIDNEISDVLKNFNLDLSDKFKYSGVKDFIDIKEKVFNTIGELFKNSNKIKTDRPYRKISQDPKITDDIAINKEIIDEFRKLCHDRKYIDNLVSDSMEKAINGPNGFTNIIKNMGSKNIDQRFVDALKECETTGSAKPLEFLKEIFGTDYNLIKKWFDKWGNLFDFKYKEITPNPSEIKFVFMITFKDKVRVIKGTGTENDLLVDLNEMRNSGYLVDEYMTSIATPSMAISQMSYSTDLLKQVYEAIVNKFKDTAVIDEDAYDALLKKYSLQNRGTIVLATTKDLETLCPSIFGQKNHTLDDEIKKIIDDIKAKIKSQYGIDYTSNLKISFKISWDAANGGGLLVEPTISDDSIKNLPGIAWDSNTKTSTSEQAKIEKIFKTIDNKYEKIITPNVQILKIKVLSGLDAATSTLYNLFKIHNKQLAIPSEINLLSKLKPGDPITIDFLEKYIDSLKAPYDKFLNDNGNKFKVEFFVEKIDQNGINIKYKITDTITKETTEVTNSVDKIPLNNIYIATTPASLNKGTTPASSNKGITSGQEKFDDDLSKVMGNTKEEWIEKLKEYFPNGIPKGPIDSLTKQITEAENLIKKYPSLIKNPTDLSNFLKSHLNLNKMLDAQKIMKKGTKIGILSLGSILGFSSLLGGANAVKVATTNKKLNAANSKNGKIKSSKKLAFASMMIGLMSAAGSIGTFIYLFLVQGGL